MKKALILILTLINSIFFCPGHGWKKSQFIRPKTCDVYCGLLLSSVQICWKIRKSPCNACPFQQWQQFGHKWCFRRSQLSPCSCSSAWSLSTKRLLLTFECWSWSWSGSWLWSWSWSFTLGQSSLQLFISKYIGTGSLSFSRGFWITVHDVSGHFSHLQSIV